MSENTYQALAEAHRNTLWHKPGRLKPREVPRPWPWPVEPSETNLNKGINTMTHPLDKAAEASFNVGTPTINEHFVSDSDRLKLSNISTLAAKTIYYFSRQAVLKDLALLCTYWLRELGVSDPWEAMRGEYDRAKQKHGDMTLDSGKPTDEQRFYAVIEEVGEIARALTYDREHARNLASETTQLLASEITQLGALALAWLAYELGKGTTK